MLGVFVALVVVASAVWVYLDATSHGIGKVHGRKGAFNRSAGEWATMTLVFWLFAFPTYLAMRRALLASAAQSPVHPPGVLPKTLVLGVIGGALIAALLLRALDEPRAQTTPASSRASAAGVRADPLLDEARAMATALRRLYPLANQAGKAADEAWECALGSEATDAKEERCLADCKGNACKRCASEKGDRFDRCFDRCRGAACNRCFPILGGKASDAERAECWRAAAERVQKLLEDFPQTSWAGCAAQVDLAIRSALERWLVDRRSEKGLSIAEMKSGQWPEPFWGNLYGGYADCSARLFLCGSKTLGAQPCRPHALARMLGLFSPDARNGTLARNTRSLQGWLHLRDGRTLDIVALKPMATSTDSPAGLRDARPEPSTPH
jgi:hypothetical protein